MTALGRKNCRMPPLERRTLRGSLSEEICSRKSLRGSLFEEVSSRESLQVPTDTLLWYSTLINCTHLPCSFKRITENSDAGMKSSRSSRRARGHLLDAEKLENAFRDRRHMARGPQLISRKKHEGRGPIYRKYCGGGDEGPGTSGFLGSDGFDLLLLC